MDSEMFKDVPIPERESTLKEMSDGVETLNFMRQLTPDEILYRKDEISFSLMKLNAEKEALKELSKEYKDRIKELDKQVQENLEGVQNGAISVTEQVYKFVDHDTEFAGYYDKNGKLVQSRKLRPEERQSNIFQVNRKAN